MDELLSKVKQNLILEHEADDPLLTLYVKGNYTKLKNAISRALLRAEITITDRRYNGHDNDTGYHQYTIDAAKYYELEE